MINSLQATPPTGTPNPLQQQANQNRLVGDIVTRNANQLEPRNVEDSQQKSGNRGVRAETEEEKLKGAKEEKKSGGLLPTPPSRMEMAIQERQKKVNQTQNVVTKFLLVAATSSGARNQPEETRSTGIDLKV